MKKLLICTLLIIGFTVNGQEIESLKSELNNLEFQKVQLENRISITRKQILKLENSKLLKEKPIFITKTKGRDIREIPQANGKVVIGTEYGESIKVYDFQEGYWKAEYKGEIGYISDAWIMETDDIAKYKEAISNKEKQDVKKAEQEKLNDELMKQRQDLEKKQLSLEKKYDKEIVDKIMKGVIWIGMTEEMARASRGSPDDINTSTGSWGVHEQWVYEKPDYKNLYLYFENGVLTSWQD